MTEFMLIQFIDNTYCAAWIYHTLYALLKSFTSFYKMRDCVKRIDRKQADSRKSDRWNIE